MRKLKLEELGRISPADFKKHPKIPLRVLMDNVRSMHNVGSVFRSSDAYLVEKIYLSGITATPPHPQIRKTALGAEDTVAWEYLKNPLDAINQCRQEGYTVLVIEQTDESIDLASYKPKPGDRYLLVFGNEVDGVSEEIIRKCDYSIEIKQFGSKHSLNVSVAAGMCLWVFGKSLIPDYQ